MMPTFTLLGAPSRAARAAVAAALLASVGAIAATSAAAQTDTAAEAPATLESYDADTVLATIGERTVTLGDLIAARQALPEQVQGLPDGQLYEGLLEQLVQESLFAKAASDAKLQDNAAVARRLEGARRQILAEAYIEQTLQPKLTDEALKARYEKELEGAEKKEEIHARHILVETEEKAKDLKSQLDGGADFEALAKEHSTGPSGPNGGDLGFFRAGQMVPEFEQAAFALEAGQVSEPVKTQFGWHLIKLEERRDVAPPPFDQVKQQINQLLARELAEKEIEKLKAEGAVVTAEKRPPEAAVREDKLLGGE